MKIFFISCLFFFGGLAAQNLSEADRKEILQSLEDQRIAWNDGSIEKYMNGYWNSDSLRFIGKRGVQYGWNSTFEN